MFEKRVQIGVGDPKIFPRPHGIGWEGKYLWCADSNLNAFFKHDPETGEIVEKIQLADSDPLPHGMSIWEGTMWYCDDVGVVCRLKMWRRLTGYQKLQQRRRGFC